MPAGVVVVKRARRRAFAILWAVPAWLHSIASSLRGAKPVASPLDALLDLEAPIENARFPALERTATGSTRCTGCGDCAPVCPSQCLTVAGVDDVPTKFALDLGACIGCGRCIEICPHAALISSAGPTSIATPPSGRVAPRDLLASAVGPQ